MLDKSRKKSSIPKNRDVSPGKPSKIADWGVINDPPVTPLIVRYRPQDWEEIYGHPIEVEALRGAIEAGDAQSFLLSGPSGLGKTTLARIAAMAAGCDPQAFVEIDAGTHTGIDDMRRVSEATMYLPLGGGRRAIIIDECHALSKQAWDSLLKSIEEPPPHVLWFFCTTNPVKIPKTVETRCFKVALHRVADVDLEALLLDVAGLEGIDLPDDVLGILIQEADGSPREALSNLALCRGAVSRADAAHLMQSALESDNTLELCRLLANGRGTWSTAMSIVKAMREASENPESVRIVVAHYFASAAIGAKNERETVLFLEILDSFSTPYNQTDGFAPLLLSVGACLFK